MEVARLWHEAGWRETVVSAGEIACGGCDAARPCRHGIIGCVTERGLGGCAECGEYPCEKLRRAFERAEYHRRRCREIFGPEWSAILEIAFFNKKENLDMLHRERIG